MSGTYEFQFQGENLVADADAALIWPERELIVVADLLASCFDALDAALDDHRRELLGERREFVVANLAG